MLRILRCLLIIAVLCGCANDPQHNTFKTRYNVYAELEMDAGSAELSVISESPGDPIDNAKRFVTWNISITELEQFADAIIRRMDAKTLAEYHQIQDEIDTLYSRFLEIPPILRDSERFPLPNHWGSLVDYCKEVTLFGFYVTRDEAAIQNMIKTIQYTRYLMSRHSL